MAHQGVRKFPQPTRADHVQFCLNEGWVQVRTATGKTGSHHQTFELLLADGRYLRTRISHPPDRTDYGKQLWSHILRDQLDVAEAEFWACVNARTAPARSRPPEAVPEALPAELVALLLHSVRIPEPEVRAMTKARAIERLNIFWATGE